MNSVLRTVRSMVQASVTWRVKMASTSTRNTNVFTYQFLVSFFNIITNVPRPIFLATDTAHLY